MAGWMGKPGSSGSAENSINPRPISALRDPASFGPPPKRDPNAPLPSSRVEDDESQEPKRPPPVPFRMNTTGLITESLPLPPKRSDQPPSDDGRKPPAIPPRLPPRREPSLPSPKEVDETGGLNLSAIGRLGKAGISVPGFNTAPKSSSTPPIGQRPQEITNPRDGGTSFAEKKAAIKTANSFYKNPMSVNASDAKAALKTGRNFQQRHGDQVAAGYKKAEEMGLHEKSKSQGGGHVQGYADLLSMRGSPSASSTGDVPPRILTPPPVRARPSPSLPIRPSGHNIQEIKGAMSPTTKKKPPPPLPPKKKPAVLPPRGSMSPAPPPIPVDSRPSPSVMSVLPNNGLPSRIFPEVPPDLDLELSTAWFSKSPLRFPKSIEEIEGKMLISTSQWTRASSGRTKHTLLMASRWTMNLSTTKIKLTWDTSAPAATVKALQRHIPPPSSPPSLDVEWGDRIVEWVADRLGQQVGNGECWTLAEECFRALHEEDERRGGDKIMIPQGTSFGLCVYSHYPKISPSPQKLPNTPLKPGDILQFRAAHWVRRDEYGTLIFEQRAGAPENTNACHDHTAIVESVSEGPKGIVVGALQQNTNGVKTVGRGEFVLGDSMIDGGVRVFRAVSDGWVEFNTEW
ncbi:hypothetical protein L873DRAFT_1787150 [Choiromyces venosus 120613-1]|uniref:BBC1/AIM3 cysteine proteinase-fold domain-containing protein n=1 Tax=Choiromyces venosus 120613-1 TaxID=1336337 RepID=A0A3N4K4M6_9PEZI|nr:hypothetical protein L873DRAFT_1787150 [Choiromyces venosus 120613-1]